MINSTLQKGLTFIGCILLLCSTSVRADEKYKKRLNPFENFYVHDVLYNARIMYPTLGNLPDNTNPWLLRINGDISKDEVSKIPVEINLQLPWLLVAGYLEINPDEKHFEDSIENSAKVNVVLGNIYKFPLYARFGYDRMPFGRHHSEVINSSQMVTQQLLKKSAAIFSTGFDYSWSAGQQFSASISLPLPVPALELNSLSSIQKKIVMEVDQERRENSVDYKNLQHQKKQAIATEETLSKKMETLSKLIKEKNTPDSVAGETESKLEEDSLALENKETYDLLRDATQEIYTISNNIEKIEKMRSATVSAIERKDDSLLNPILNIRYQKTSPTRLGRWLNFDRLDVGMGLGVHGNFSSPLFNFNSDVDFAKVYNFRFEYSYHSTLHQLGWGSALHTEISKRFSTTLPLVKWSVPSAFVGGYEFGSKEIAFEGELQHQNNLFGGVKAMPWKQYITAVLGGKHNFHTGKLGLLARLNVELPLS